MRKKILLIFTLLLIFTVSLSLDSYTYTEDDRVYTWEDTSITANGLTLTIDEETQIFTITGSMTSTQSMFVIPQSLYTANDALSSLSSSNDYIIEYENINDTTFDATVMVFRFNTVSNADNAYQDIKVDSADLTNKAYSVLSSDGIQSEPSFLVYGAFDNDVDISFNLNIYEYDTRTLSSVDLFDTNMSITEGSLDITITDFNTITLDGSSSSSEASISLTNYLNDAIDDSKTYLIKYIYVSGSMTDSIGQKLYPFKINDQNAIKISEANKDMFQAISIPDIITLSLNPYISGNVSYTNFTYKLLLEEVGADAVVVDDDPVVDNYNINDWIELDGYLYYDMETYQPTAADELMEIAFNPLFDITDYEYAASSADQHTAMPVGTTGIMVQYTQDNVDVHSYTVRLKPGNQIVAEIQKSTAVFPDLSDISIRIALTPAVINYYVDGSIDDTVNSTIGSDILRPTDPTLADHTFIGWYLEDTYTTLFDFNDALDVAELNLYARFVADSIDVYTITFDTNNGSLIDAQNVVSGETATEPSAPSRSGYTFNGWFSDEELTTSYDFASLVDADTTIYAKWTLASSAPVAPNNTITNAQWALIALAVGIVAIAITKYSKK